MIGDLDYAYKLYVSAKKNDNTMQCKKIKDLSLIIDSLRQADNMIDNNSEESISIYTATLENKLAKKYPRVKNAILRNRAQCYYIINKYDKCIEDCNEILKYIYYF